VRPIKENKDNAILYTPGTTFEKKEKQPLKIRESGPIFDLKYKDLTNKEEKEEKVD